MFISAPTLSPILNIIITSLIQIVSLFFCRLLYPPCVLVMSDQLHMRAYRQTHIMSFNLLSSVTILLLYDASRTHLPIHLAERMRTRRWELKAPLRTETSLHLKC